MVLVSPDGGHCIYIYLASIYGRKYLDAPAPLPAGNTPHYGVIYGNKPSRKASFFLHRGVTVEYNVVIFCFDAFKYRDDPKLNLLVNFLKGISGPISRVHEIKDSGSHN
jgi:hypothetical protein